MPTATDLVTDLPADFAVFGQGVDTSMQYLLGGTTGQILSKTSGTNMAFTWINNDQGDITGITATSPLTGGGSSGAITVGIQDATTSVKGSVQLSDSTSTTSSVLAATPTAVKSAYDLADAAIAKTTVTTAGDIIYRNATVPTRLGIGTAGQVLTVNSGATAPQWSTAGGGGMVLISRASFSNVATTGSTFEGMFSSSYFNYQIVIHQITAATPGDDLLFNWKYGSTTYTTNTVYYASIATYNATAANIGTITAASAILTRECGTAPNSNGGNIWTQKVGNGANQAQATFLMANPYGGEMSVGAIGMDSSTNTITGFVLKSSSSNITGTVSVYAYPN